MASIRRLLNTLPQQGTVVWIGVRPQRRAPMESLKHVEASTKSGLLGDRYQGRSGQRQVTILQDEHLPVIASCLGHEVISAATLRRNLVVRGINLLALRDQMIVIGSVELQVTGLCHPCSRMEEYLGAGGYNAVRGHGGVTARVLSCGTIGVGDPVRLLSTPGHDTMELG